MKNYSFFKNFVTLLKEYILIFLTATTFLFITFTKSFSEENVFAINNIEVSGTVDLNFSREKYLDKAFSNSFEILMTKILLSGDLNKIDDIKLKEIKDLINSFQILHESYSKNEYKIITKIIYDDIKVKKFLGRKNISFSQPTNISVLFYPVFFINGEIKNFNENFFYKNWEKILIENEIINFILPLEDLEDLSEITKMKNKIEELEISNLVNEYDIKNYVFSLMEYQNKKLNVHLKTDFNNSKTNKNISYNIENINDTSELTLILKDLKLKISDLWKEENLINLLMPLSIRLKYQHTNLENLEKIRNIINKISIVDNYNLEEFNVKNSYFKIYYYGDPKKLKSELLKFGYQLTNEKGYWEVSSQ